MNEELAHALRAAVRESIGSERSVGVLFSGGLDSSLVAKLASEVCGTVLFTSGVAHSPDVECAKKVAAEMNLRSVVVVLDEMEIAERAQEAKRILGAFLNGRRELMELALAVPTLACCDAARRQGIRVLLCGSGAEELFAGYARHKAQFFADKNKLAQMLAQELEALEKNDFERCRLIGEATQTEIRSPLLNAALVRIAQRIPVEQKISQTGTRKLVLRETAQALGVPAQACWREKKAMQYGSGVQKALLRLMPQPNFFEKRER
jgi:asparagine synthase (glutamine-hydrolysing)